jgi:VIT1/CCC1 family predicted Fe2+/Mn2+ transporter
MIPAQYVFSIFFLVLLGAVSAKAGGSGIAVAVGRISFWGTVAMAVTAAVGYLFGVAAA